jgi:small GTP-binding protein
MTGMVLEGRLAELREREVKLLYDVAEYLNSLGSAEEDRKRLLDSAADLKEMFLMVVIIGEFNAGKSSFVNALLRDALLPMGITPTTDAIELIRHAPVKETSPKQRSDALREWYHPNTGAPGVVIVDTPGTGSVFAKHEQIAKSFLHRSDLVIFVISAKRAFAETERLYLDLAKNYGKKIIIVVNQADLLEGREYQEVRDFVGRQIDELLDIRPPIFMISAKKSLQGDKAAAPGAATSSAARGDWGMDFVRDHLRQTFEQVPPAKQKLIAQIGLMENLAEKYRGTLGSRLNLVSGDTSQAEDIQKDVEAHAASLDRQLASTMTELHNILEDVRRRGETFIDERLKVLNALRGLDKDKIRADFEKGVVGDAVTRLKNTSETYVNSVVDGSRAYWRGVIERLSKIEAILQAEGGALDAATYADQRAALQNALTTANAQLQSVSDQSVVEHLQQTFNQNVRGFALSVTGVITGLLAFIVSAATGISAAQGLTIVFGVIFAPIALIGGGIGAAVYYNKATADAKKELSDALKKLEDSYRAALTDLTTRERARLIQYGNQILAPVFSQLQTLTARYRDQQSQLDNYLRQAQGLRAEIDAVQVAPEPEQIKT